MEYRTLGKSGLSVSRLAFGSLTVAPMQAGLPTDEGAEVIAYAFDKGVNFIDTAQYYDNYEYIRKALRLTKRNDIVVSTKSYAYSKETAIQAVEEARKKLDRDVIEVFMLHETESYLTIRGHMEAIEYYGKCKSLGIIKAVGVSTHHVAGVRGAIQMGFFDIIHPLYNAKGIGIADGSAEDMGAAIKAAHDDGIGIFAMKSLAGGHLHSDAANAFDFVLSKDYVDSVAVGMQSMKEVDANIAYFEGRGFTAAEDAALKAKNRTLHVSDWCEGCGKCIERCGQGALAKGPDGKTVCDRDKCVLCGYCSAVCPVFALKVF